MDDTNQIEPPASFVALYSSADGTRLTRHPADVVARYELCEDLAHTISDRAPTMLAESGGLESQVIDHVRRGLLSGETPLSEPEANWVASRMCELLGWKRG
jgi:hypothetical protein